MFHNTLLNKKCNQIASIALELSGTEQTAIFRNPQLITLKSTEKMVLILRTIPEAVAWTDIELF